MPMRTATVTVLALLCTIAVAGCATSPRTDFYTLSRVAQGTGAAPADYAVAVGPVTVPATVDRPQMVVRKGPSQLSYEEYHQWGAPLQDEIGRVVAGNLSTLLGTPRVAVFPRHTVEGARYRVAVDVVAFDTTPGEGAALDALWSVRSTKDGAVRGGRTTVSEAAKDGGYASLVAAHDRALGKLSGDIAAAIRALEGAGG
jgi:uncharacterized lipoprotein YmbA